MTGINKEVKDLCKRWKKLAKNIPDRDNKLRRAFVKYVQYAFPEDNLVWANRSNKLDKLVEKGEEERSDLEEALEELFQQERALEKELETEDRRNVTLPFNSEDQ